jgi:hypothetical protein
VTRGPFWLTTRRCLRVGAWPVALAAALAVLLHHAVPPVLGDRTAPAAASPWLVLPLLVAAASTTLTAIVTWPLFARDEPGNGVLARIQRGACGGCAAALAGALVAQGLLTLPTALLVPFALGAPATARLVHVLETSGTTVLARGHDAVDFTLPSAARVERIELRPRAGLPEGTSRRTSAARSTSHRARSGRCGSCAAAAPCRCGSPPAAPSASAPTACRRGATRAG